MLGKGRDRPASQPYWTRTHDGGAGVASPAPHCRTARCRERDRADELGHAVLCWACCRLAGRLRAWASSAVGESGDQAAAGRALVRRRFVARTTAHALRWGGFAPRPPNVSPLTRLACGGDRPLPGVTSDTRKSARPRLIVLAAIDVDIAARFLRGWEASRTMLTRFGVRT